jgi:hypothetical protein
MRQIAEQIVDAMLEGRVKDWLSDKWNSVKAVTGIGGDEFGLGKNTEKGWKPKYGPVSSGGTTFIKRPVRAKPRQDEPGPKTWDITP